MNDIKKDILDSRDFIRDVLARNFGQKVFDEERLKRAAERLDEAFRRLS